jgi:cysteinyl-tRNA synthetase
MKNYINHDFVDKTLRYLGYDVTRAMNITDVGHLTSDSDSGEDKMLKAVKREHLTAMEIAKKYTDEFFKDFNKVNNRMPEIVVPATSEIDMYIKMIQTLLDKGYAYQSGGNIYFDVSKLDDYYVLTNHKVDEMVVGVREGVEEDLNKRNQGDFALWFTKSKFEDQELKWDSPWGVGYPGWHIECSGISIKYLGERIDIHCGAEDAIFPHHTNEIAQSEAYLGHKWCNYWIHFGFLNDKDGKMSKSKGEFLTVSLLESKGYDPLAYRYLCLKSYYHSALTFSYDILDGAVNEYNKLKNKTLSLTDEGTFEEEKYNEYNNRFKEALDNDLNTSMAITILYELLKDNTLNDKTKKELVSSFDKVLSLDLLKKKEETIDNELDSYVKEMIEKRKEAKMNKDFALADSIRNELLEKGIMLKDTREGTTYEVIK